MTRAILKSGIACCMLILLSLGIAFRGIAPSIQFDQLLKGGDQELRQLTIKGQGREVICHDPDVLQYVEVLLSNSVRGTWDKSILVSPSGAMTTKRYVGYEFAGRKRGRGALLRIDPRPFFSSSRELADVATPYGRVVHDFLRPERPAECSQGREPLVINRKNELSPGRATESVVLCFGRPSRALCFNHLGTRG